MHQRQTNRRLPRGLGRPKIYIAQARSTLDLGQALPNHVEGQSARSLGCSTSVLLTETAVMNDSTKTPKSCISRKKYAEDQDGDSEAISSLATYKQLDVFLPVLRTRRVRPRVPRAHFILFITGRACRVLYKTAGPFAMAMSFQIEIGAYGPALPILL